MANLILIGRILKSTRLVQIGHLGLCVCVCVCGGGWGGGGGGGGGERVLACVHMRTPICWDACQDIMKV